MFSHSDKATVASKELERRKLATQMAEWERVNGIVPLTPTIARIGDKKVFVSDVEQKSRKYSAGIRA